MITNFYLAVVRHRVRVRLLVSVVLLTLLPLTVVRSNEVINGMRIVEGDIFVAKESAVNEVVASQWQQRGLGLPQSARVWPNGLIPYFVDEKLDPTIVVNIATAVDEWNQVAGVTLYPVTSDALPADYLHFQAGDGCASWVGFRGGAQEVWLSSDCNAGSIMHEIGHAMGLEHEHTRLDRDQYIEVLWDNIYAEKRHNFDISDRNGPLLGDYDYGSIMHYGLTHFSQNGLATIRAVRETSQSIGQRSLPSVGDIQSVAQLYASDVAVVTQLENDEATSTVTLYITNDHSQGAHDIVINLQTGQPALAASDVDDVTCLPIEKGAECRLASLAGGATRIARLDFERIVDETLIETRLHSKTPDTNMANNSGGVASEPVLARAQQVYSDANAEKVYTGKATIGMLLTLLLLCGCRFGRGISRRCCTTERIGT